MKIRGKIVFVILPVLIVSILLVGISSYLLASSGINRLARDFLGFKVTELQKYAISQYQLLVENNLQDSPEYLQATRGSIEVYAASIIRSNSELIIAVDSDGNLQLATSDTTLKTGEKAALARLHESRESVLIEPKIAGITRVAKGFYFQPFDWYVIVSEQRDVFFQDINRIA
ncbi:MAG: adenylate/guanylate cyclase domain-containing protein, partial [Spirochaetaceae bacterium]